MEQVLLFVLLGLGGGALIAGIALGVVLTYRGSGIINLATGAVAMVAGYSFWSLQSDFYGFTLGTAPAFVVTRARVRPGRRRSWSSWCSGRCGRRRRWRR